MPEPICSLIDEKFWKDIVREAQTHAKPLNEFSEKKTKNPVLKSDRARHCRAIAK